MALQEIKADQFRLNLAFRSILPEYHPLSAEPDEGKGGTALLIHPALGIRSSGHLDRGRTVWAQLQLGEYLFGIVSIYAPNKSRDRAVLWTDLKQQLPQDHWIVAGDFNMIKSNIDSMGHSSRLRGSEAEAWRLLKMRFDFEDALNMLENVGDLDSRGEEEAGMK